MKKEEERRVYHCGMQPTLYLNTLITFCHTKLRYEDKKYPIFESTYCAVSVSSIWISACNVFSPKLTKFYASFLYF